MSYAAESVLHWRDMAAKSYDRPAYAAYCKTCALEWAARLISGDAT